MKNVLFVTLCLTVGGYTLPIEMVNSRSGQTIKCGPYLDATVGNAMRESQCIRDYQRQGFERRLP